MAEKSKHLKTEKIDDIHIVSLSDRKGGGGGGVININIS